MRHRVHQGGGGRVAVRGTPSASVALADLARRAWLGWDLPAGEPPGLEEMKKRRAAVLDIGLPHLVAVRDDKVMGYAYASNWRPRPAYKFSVEDSIYIDKDAVGQGVGKALLPVLIEQCAALGKKQMVAVIGDSAQTPSIRLHAACGFRMVGTLENIGFKFGRWLDSVLMQRAL